MLVDSSRYMDVKDAIRRRHSIRSFSDKKLPADLIYEMIEYANLAPSAGNLQAREFIVVDDPEVKKRLSDAALDQEFIAEAPVDIVVCVHLDRISPYGKRGKELYCLQDAAAAVEHILLLAVNYGLVTCWVGAFDENMVSKILNSILQSPYGIKRNIPYFCIVASEIIHF